VTVYNVAGQKLMQAKGVNQIEVASLTAGIYFIKINEINSEVTLKFIKQ
jgi:predicted S18 family serine protease